MEIMMMSEKYYPEEETASLENKMIKAAEKIIKMRACDEACNCKLKENINQLNVIRREQRAIIHAQLKKINNLESELEKYFKQYKDIDDKDNITSEICINIENQMKALITTLNICQNDRQKLSEYYTLAVATINKNIEVIMKMEKYYIKNIEDLRSELNTERENKLESIKTWKDSKNILLDIIESLENKCIMQTNDGKQFKQERDENENNLNSARINIIKLSPVLKRSKQIVSILEVHVNHANNENIKLKAENETIIMEFKNRISKLETDIDASKVELIYKDSCTKNIIDEKNKLDMELETLQNNMKNNKTQYEELEIKLSDIKFKNYELQKKRAESNEEILHLKNIVSKLNATVLKYTEDNDSFELSIDQSSNVLKDKEIQWKHERSIIMSNIAIIKAENKKIIDLNKKTDLKINSLEIKLHHSENTEKENVRKYKTLHEDFSNKVNSLKAEIKTFRDEINSIKKHNQHSTIENELLKSEISVLKNYTNNKKEEINLLTAEIHELRRKLDTKSKECEEISDNPVKSKQSKTPVNTKSSMDTIFDSLLIDEHTCDS